MAHLNKTCLCCSTNYSYCPSCSRLDALKETWYNEFCSESCKDLWLTLTRFGMNSLTKSEAKNIISALDLKPIESYVPCVQRDYSKVMKEERKPKRGKRAEVKIFDDAMNIGQEVFKIIVEEHTEHEVVKTEKE